MNCIQVVNTVLIKACCLPRSMNGVYLCMTWIILRIFYSNATTFEKNKISTTVGVTAHIAHIAHIVSQTLVMTTTQKMVTPQIH